MSELANAEVLTDAAESAAEDEKPALVVSKPSLDSDRCTACAICVVVCPHGAIEMTSTRLGQQTIVVPAISDRCVACGVCTEICPSRALSPPV